MEQKNKDRMLTPPHRITDLKSIPQLNRIIFAGDFAAYSNISASGILRYWRQQHNHPVMYPKDRGGFMDKTEFYEAKAQIALNEENRKIRLLEEFKH